MRSHSQTTARIEIVITISTTIRMKKNKHFGPCIRAILDTYCYKISIRADWIYQVESHNWIKSCILIGLRSEVFSVELRVENEA